MTINHIIILGAGPAGLATALAIVRQRRTASVPGTSLELSAGPPNKALNLHITILELRAQAGAPLGGAVNLTPLALRYLDRIGAGVQIRRRGMRCSAIELLSLRTGRLLGRLWPDVDALRVRRTVIVESLLETCAEDENRDHINVRFGVKVCKIAEEESVDGQGSVVVTLESGETVKGDLLVGCDGIHSIARRRYVDPDRQIRYSGKAVAYGISHVEEAGKTAMVRSDGVAAVADTTLISGRWGALMTTFADPAKDELHVACVMGVEAPAEEDEAQVREGWKTRGQDRQKVRDDVISRFSQGNVTGLLETVEGVQDWNLYPVYELGPGGHWIKGRVIIIGDAAHAVRTS